MAYPSRIDPERLGSQALAIVEARGWEHWSLRDVARSLGVSANALYRYVGDREGLVIAIAAVAAQELYKALSAEPSTEEDRLIQMAHRYVDFATERPAAYAAFIHAKPALDHPAMQAWTQVWTHVRGEIALRLPQAADAAAFAFWALVHGRADLAKGPARLASATDGLDHAVIALIKGFESMGEVSSPLPPHLAIS